MQHQIINPQPMQTPPSEFWLKLEEENDEETRLIEELKKEKGSKQVQEELRRKERESEKKHAELTAISSSASDYTHTSTIHPPSTTTDS